MILGSGGSSKSINYALNLIKSQATIISRTNKEEAISYQDLNERADEVEVIINTTPIGMPQYENENLDINVENFNNLELVMNIGYGPNNNFLTLFNDNIQKFDGLGMLICQAIESFNIWTSSELTVTSIYDEVFKELEKQHD